MSDDANRSACAALADDAETLARLHDRELDAGTLAALREIAFPDNLALLPADAEARDARDAMRAALAALPATPGAADLETLAVEFAAIYLTGAYGAFPAESPWLDDDRLVCQQPMFELREIYQAAGLAAENWRIRPDDHLVMQLQYLAHRLRRTTSAESLIELGQFLDSHLLRWLPNFAARVASRAEHPLYPALALLTLTWCKSFMKVAGNVNPA